MLDFFGGRPAVVVPDNLRSGVSKACRYDPDLNPSYQQCAEHYDIAVVPARPFKPKDKSKAEVAVQVVQRWILARLRHHSFFSLAELNQCIRTLLADLNSQPFKQLPGCRQPDEKYGEQVCAWIHLKEGMSLSEEDVRAFCRDKITHFKIPYYIRFVDEFPMTVTGKIQKFKMREMMEKELEL